MSAIFPKRGRRENTADESFVDLEARPPLTEKRHHSPFSYLRIRKRSTDSPKREKEKGSPQTDPAVRRYDSADSLDALYDPDPRKPLPPVPPLLNHNRGYSDPQLVYGAQVYPQVRSPLPMSPNASQVSIPYTPPPRPGQFAPQWDAPSVENILPNVQSLMPAPAPMLATAAVMSASESQSQARSQISGLPRGMGSDHPDAHGAHGLMATVRMDKAKVAATVGPLITVGMQNLTKAQTVVDEVVASEAWSVVKENVTAVLAPAKDVVAILDSVAKYVPVLMVAETIFSVIIKHELDRHENDKNILVVYHTMSVFWFTLCDLQAIFRAAGQIKSSMDNFFEGGSSKFSCAGRRNAFSPDAFSHVTRPRAALRRRF